MTSFFTNPAISCTIVEQVPCAFAPSKGKNSKGEDIFGTHYACLMLNTDGNILHMSCQCEDKHGTDVINTMEEMGGGTCFQYVGKLRDILTGHISIYEITKIAGKHGSAIKYQLDQLVRGIANKRDERRLENLRLDNRMVVSTGPHKTAQLLTAVAKTVSGVPLIYVQFVQNTHTQDSSFLSLMVGTKCIATRNMTAKVWSVDSSIPKDLEGKVVLTHDAAQRFHAHGSRSSEECAVCHKSFERMGKHTKSESHRDALNEAINRALKFTAGPGLNAVKVRGAAYFKATGRLTKGKVAVHDEHIAYYLERLLPSPSDWKLYSGALGLKNLAVERYVERTGMPTDEAWDVFKAIEQSSSHITKLESR